MVGCCFKVRLAEVKKVSVLCLQYIILNLYNVATKMYHENIRVELFKSDQQLPFPTEIDEDKLTQETIDDILRLPSIFREDNAVNANARNQLCTLAHAMLKPGNTANEIMDNLRSLFQLFRDLITEWQAENKVYLGTVPGSSPTNSNITVEINTQSNCLYVHWPPDLGNNVVSATLRLQQMLRKENRQPTEDEYFFTHLAYHEMKNNTCDRLILQEEMQPLGTPGFRPHTQTYIALTDPGEGHILGTVRRGDWLKGSMVHVEYVERPRNLKRNECESYRFPSSLEFARVRLHVGADAPTTLYVGRPMKDGGDFGMDFLKVVNMTASAVSNVFSLGAAECKISMEGLSTSEALRYMRALRAQVRRSKKQVLSAAWNLNQSWIDDIDNEGNIVEDKQKNTKQRKLKNKKDIAMKAVITTSLGGFDKVTLDGACDTSPSTCFLQDCQLAKHDALTVVHEAHERGLLTYFSAGFKYENIPCAVSTGVDGVGIGGAGILHYVDKVSGFHGPYMEENISEILQRRDVAANTTLGKGALLLARLDTMYNEGSISDEQNVLRKDLFCAILALDDEKITSLLCSLQPVLNLPSEGASPFLHRAKRLVDADDPVLQQFCDKEEWKELKRELQELILKHDEESIMREYDNDPWQMLRKEYHKSTKTASPKFSHTLKV